MSVRGVDSQIMATKPAELSGNQNKVNKQAETQMAQNASAINKDAELNRERTVKAASSEGKKIGTEERERGSGSGGGKGEDKETEQDGSKFVDPMLSLPVEKGKYAKREEHFINIEV